MGPTPMASVSEAERPSWLEIADLTAPLSPAELRVFAALPKGAEVDLRGADGDLVPIRANVIRAIVTGVAMASDQIDPRGVRVKGALFAERLDLDDTNFARPLTFSGCTFAAGLSAERADLHALNLEGCAFVAPDDQDAVMLDQARIAHRLSLEDSHVTGALRLLGASIRGQLDCTDATFANETGPALHAEGLTTTNHVHLNGTFTGTGSLGAVRLLGASIGGQLSCADCTFTNNTGPALHADGLTTTNDVDLNGTFTGTGELSTVRLLGANIGGQLNCSGGTFTNNTGPALSADGVTTTDHVHLNGTFTGTGELSTVRLLGANIGGQLNCSGGTFTNNTGPALGADNLNTGNSVHLNGIFTGASEIGAVRLPGAKISGQLICSGGSFTNDAGPALFADRLTTTNHVYLRARFSGVGEFGTVRLLGANIGGDLGCVDGSLASLAEGALNLQGAKLAGRWHIDPAFRAPSTCARWLDLDGFTFAGIPQGFGDAKHYEAKDWSRVLREQTPRYAAQPYQHLAAAYRAAGHDEDAKTILIAQQDDRRERVVKSSGKWFRSPLMRAAKLLTGYGYQSYRALAALLVLAVFGIVAASIAGSWTINTNTDPAKAPNYSTVLAHKPSQAQADAPCSPVELAGVGLEWSVPILATKVSDTCVLNTTDPAGQVWTVASWVLRLAGWAFATLAVAGYTGIIRRL